MTDDNKTHKVYAGDYLGNASGPHIHYEMITHYNLAYWQARIKEINVANGWFDPDKPRCFGDDIALLHTEVSETYEAYRDWGFDDKTNDLCKKGIDVPIEGAEAEEAGLVLVGADHEGHICKPEGVGSELADVLVRLLDTCERYGVDIEFELDRKLNYNATRGYRHGGKRV